MHNSSFESNWLALMERIMRFGMLAETRQGSCKEKFSEALSFEPYFVPGIFCKTRKLDAKYCELFADFLCSHKADEEGQRTFADYPKAKCYFDETAKYADKLPKNFSASYGPRLAQQKAFVLDQLCQHKNSRRAVQILLDANDAIICDLPDGALVEYSCTESLQWQLRDNELYLHVHMRSSSVWQILPIDAYNFQCYGNMMAKDISAKLGKKIELECINMTFGNAHIFERDAFKILSVIGAMF